MSRTLSANVAGLLASGTTRVCHLLDFAVGAVSYRFAEDAVTHNGNVYLPRLVLDSPVRFSEKLRLDPVIVKLENIDLATAQMLDDEGGLIQGVEATLSRLYLAARETVTLFIGQISDVEVDEREARLTLAGDLDPTATQVPKRKYSHLNSADGKTFLEMAATPHLFDGFLHITRDLTLAVEGQTGEPEDDRALAEFGYD